MTKKYWLLKSEPNTWSWKDQNNVKKDMWDGVRNYQARNNLKKMKKNDLCFFYHTGDEKKIIGTCKVVKEYFLDKSDKDKKFVSVMIKNEKKYLQPVTLNSIKQNPFFKDFILLKQSRLSVLNVDIKYWKKICKMSNIYQN